MNELYKHPYLISQSNTCMFLVISHRRKFYWLRRKIWAQNFNETMFTIFLQNKPWSYESYDWTTSQTTSSLYLGGFRCLNCYLSHIRKPGGDWMNWTLNILSNRNYYYPRALRISLPLWQLIKWDIGLMSFTPGHQEPSFSLLQHKWFGPKAGTCNKYKTIMFWH